jgi:predicted lipoprotein with Yx(FWY)xxD motif
MRIATVLSVLVAAVGVVGAQAASAPTLTTAKVTGVGTLVVSGDGLTLYSYGAEKAGQIACTGACAKAWPPVLVKAGATPVGGTGIKSTKLGTVKRPDGGLQVTYGGHALYRFKGDAKAGDANGQGVSDKWYALSPAGGVVTTLPPQAVPNSGGSSSGGSSTTVPSSGGVEVY